MMNLSDLKVFVRSLLRNKLYSVITVFGFAVSLTFVILLSVYIRQELSVDQFHVNKDRVFRITSEDDAHWGALVSGQLKAVTPEIESCTRVYEGKGEFCVKPGGDKLNMNVLYIDTAFLEMFTFPLVEGQNFKASREVVVSRSFGRKMFGEDSPLGKDLNLGNTTGWTIVGVVEDFPENTQFDRCDVLLNFTALNAGWISTNNSAAFDVYLLEKEGADLCAKTEVMLEQLKKDFWMYQNNYRTTLTLEPLSEVYWSSAYGNGIHRNSRTFLTVLMAIVGVILLLALINYNNLSVARAGFRAKESAVKKLLGSNNGALFGQYVVESVALCYGAFAIACVLAVSVLPWFNSLLETHIVVSQHLTVSMVVAALFAVGVIGVISGLAPAWIITRFNPVEVVKGAFRKKTKGVYSKVLICFQYCVAITLIICTLVIWKQTGYMRNYKLGFDKENIVWLGNRINNNQKDALESEFKQIPGVQLVSFVAGSPLDGGNNNTMSDYGGTGKQISFQTFMVDSNFFDMLNIKVESIGAAYDNKGVWLNETALRAIGAEGVPAEFFFYETKCPVLGVVKDFHISDLTEELSPVIIRPLQPNSGFWQILVKIAPENPAGTFDRIKKVYSKFIDGVPFESGFMDQTINEWYKDNARTASIIGYFSVLSIILSMMGILAMATYFIQQRVKEVGLRRVNGATIRGIIEMLMGGFMKWIVLSFVLSCPIAYYVMNHWLQDFPYRIGISWWLFAVSGLFAFLVAGLMVGWQSYKAATTNPVESLKSE